MPLISHARLLVLCHRRYITEKSECYFYAVPLTWLRFSLLENWQEKEINGPNESRTQCKLIQSIIIIAPCKEIQDSLGLWIPRNGFRIPATGLRILLSVELGIWILSLTGFRIPRVVFRIPDFKARIFWIAESGFPYMGRFTMSYKIIKLHVTSSVNSILISINSLFYIAYAII